MAARDDFGSNSKSPGGWGGTGTGSSMSGMGGQKASTYDYSGMGQNKIGNFNTGGAKVGAGNQFGVNRNTGMLGPIGRGPWPGGYATPVLRKPVMPPAGGVPAAYQPNPPITQEDIPGVLGTPPAPVMSQYGPRAQGVPPGQYGARNPASGFSLANFGPQGTWGNAQQTTINKSPGGGGYTNINKNGGGYGYSSFGGPR